MFLKDSNARDAAAAHRNRTDAACGVDEDMPSNNPSARGDAAHDHQRRTDAACGVDVNFTSAWEDDVFDEY